MKKYKTVIALTALLLSAGSVLGILPLNAFATSENTEKTVENSSDERLDGTEITEDSRGRGGFRHNGKRRCPRCENGDGASEKGKDDGRKMQDHRPGRGEGKPIPPEWRRGRAHRPMPLPETEENEVEEIPDNADDTEREASAAANAAHNWYCMRNTSHTLPPIDRGMEFITEYNTVYADVAAAEKGDKVIYLTFDAGYENGNVGKILDVLKKHNAPGAFFVLENLIKREPELVKRMANEGHLVCNHTMKHRDMTKIHSVEEFAAELEGLERYAEESIGIKLAKFYRPPEGRFSRRDLGFAEQLGYRTVFWSFAYADWDNARQPDQASAIAKILDNAHPGEIMLLHPTSATNAAVLDRVLSQLESEGYRFGSLCDIK
ncbi:MAG: polysaccharide deacetylase family protein [Clostridia bacterium]|nr:polysaccharide deacetylase family protein [Clostridia bacterium]